MESQTSIGMGWARGINSDFWEPWVNIISLKGAEDYNCHGDLCQTAHNAGDTGGEFISVEQLSEDVFNYDTKWNIPTDDLLEIFRRMGRNVTLQTFNKCATLFYLESTAI